MFYPLCFILLQSIPNVLNYVQNPKKKYIYIYIYLEKRLCNQPNLDQNSFLKKEKEKREQNKICCQNTNKKSWSFSKPEIYIYPLFTHFFDDE